MSKSHYQKRVDKGYSQLSTEQLEQQITNMLNSNWYSHHKGKLERSLQELSQRKNEKEKLPRQKVTSN